MNARHAMLLGLAIHAVAIVAPAHAVTFSIVPGLAAPYTGDDLLNPGPAPAVPGYAPGGINVDAFSYDHFGPLAANAAIFSVSPGASGVVGSAVAAQAATFDEPADIYSSSFAGSNSLLYDGNGSSGPPLGLTEPFILPGDDVDGLDARFVSPLHVYWSVDPLTLPAGGGGIYSTFGAADIFIAPAVANYTLAPSLYASSAFLGLAASDDIDAVVVFEDGVAGFNQNSDTVFFSLAPGSPFLALAGAGPGDIFVAGAAAPGGVTSVYKTAASLGLSANDNLDALDLVPEPSALVLAILALSAFVLPAVHRRRVS